MAGLFVCWRALVTSNRFYIQAGSRSSNSSITWQVANDQRVGEWNSFDKTLACRMRITPHSPTNRWLGQQTTRHLSDSTPTSNHCSATRPHHFSVNILSFLKATPLFSCRMAQPNDRRFGSPSNRRWLNPAAVTPSPPSDSASHSSSDSSSSHSSSDSSSPP